MTTGEHTLVLVACDHLLSLRIQLYSLILAITWNSLAHFSERTIRHCSTTKWFRCFNALSVCNHLISCSLHLPQGVLCNFHSRYYYAIGLEMYLGLEVYASHIHARFPAHVTLDT
jgi:hypothetical protein